MSCGGEYVVAVPEPGPGPDGGPEHNPDGAVPGPAGGTGRWFAPLAGPDSSAGADADRREPGAASGVGKPAEVLRHDIKGSSDPFGPRPRHAGSEPPGSAPQQQHRESVPGSAAEAIAMTLAGLGFLAHADAASLPAGTQADCLRELERALAVHTAARARVLAAFTAQGGHEQDGQGSPRTWLTWQTRITRPAAAAAAGWTRRLAGHPAVRDALARGEVSQSWARQICDWTDQLPAGHRDQADAILLAAAAGGADLPGLAELAGQIRARLAGPDRDRGDGSPAGACGWPPPSAGPGGSPATCPPAAPPPWRPCSTPSAPRPGRTTPAPGTSATTTPSATPASGSSPPAACRAGPASPYSSSCT
jgi:hypothetical protein